MGASWLANPRETRAVLDRFGLATKHRLGQNFLVDDDVIVRILDLAQIDGDDVVLEVGPGIGTLTVALLEHASAVCSIEADRELECVLAMTCAKDSDRFALVMGDALRVGEGDVRAALAALGTDVAPRKFVSNLPYQVATALIMSVSARVPRRIPRTLATLARIEHAPGIGELCEIIVYIRCAAIPTVVYRQCPVAFAGGFILKGTTSFDGHRMPFPRSTAHEIGRAHV